MWLGNNRGTEYSREHTELNALNDSDYWLFSFAEMGLYDDTANITMIKEKTGADKIFYLGYSQGTLQINYGLAHLESEFYADNLYKVVELAPCYVTAGMNSIDMFNKTTMEFQDKGINSINGPNRKDDLAKICWNWPSQCPSYTASSTMETLSVQNIEHLTMNTLMNRFQEFAYNWEEGEYETPLVQLENISKVPIAFFTATRD